MKSINVVITMAGLGKRFRDAGYDCAKYRIVAHGKTLFTWSMTSLRNFIEAGAIFTFIVRAEDQAADFIRSESKALGIKHVNIIEIDQLTDGQATSAFIGVRHLEDQSCPLLIYNIDTFVHPNVLLVSDVRGAGWIPCFPGQGDGWSFAKVDQTGKVEELREKSRISAHATIGLYWFQSAEDFAKAYDQYYQSGKNMERGEKYVAPMYNEMIRSGLDVFIHEVPYDAVIPLGIPSEVDAFLHKSPPSL